METDKEYRELWGEKGEIISNLVRKHHFYTAWKNGNKAMILEIAEKIRNDFNEWKAKKENISDVFIRREYKHWDINGTDNDGFYEQAKRKYELISPFENRLEKDWHLMHCFHHNYKKARYEFVSLILGNY